MAVSQAAFEALQPTPYSQARPYLRTGDILLFNSHNLGSDIIEYFTHSLWCHAAMVFRMDEIKRVFILESVDTYGVRMMPLSVKLNGNDANMKPYPGKVLVGRHADASDFANLDKVSSMTQFALDRLGSPYDMRELVEIGARIGAGLVGLKLPDVVTAKHAFICSEYVAACYQELGITLRPDNEGFLAPADIANDPKIEAIYSMVGD